MSMISLLAGAVAAGGTKPVYSLVAEPISNIVPDPANAEAGIRFNSDGTVDKNEDGSYAQIGGASLDWISPRGYSTTQDFEVRYTNLQVGDDFTSKAAAEDAWVSISTNPVWIVTEGDVATKTVECDFEIRDGADVEVVAAVTYTIVAQVESGA